MEGSAEDASWEKGNVRLQEVVQRIEEGRRPGLLRREKMFFDALPNLEEEEGVLNLPEGVNWIGLKDYGRSIFIRKSYKDLYLLLSQQMARGLRKFIVTGTPGIGKSFFSLYCLFRCVKERRRVLFEVEERGFLWLPDAPVIAGKRDHFAAFYTEGDILYLVDARRDIRFRPNCPTILFSSPRASNFHEFLKSGADLYFMPLWSMKELELVRERIFADDVSPLRFNNICAVYGPIPRYALHWPAEKPHFGNWSTDSVRNRTVVLGARDRLGQAIANADVSSYFSFEGFETGNYTNSFSFLVLHMDTRDFISLRFRWASTYVWDVMMQRHRNEMLHFARRLVVGASEQGKLGSLAGHTFQHMMQDVMRDGCSLGGQKVVFKLKALRNVPKSSSREVSYGTRSADPPIPTRRLPRLEYSALTAFNQVKEYIYYQPENPSEAAVDAFVLMGSELVMFQFTVAKSHGVNKEGVMNVLRKVGFVEKVFLVFVLPRHRYQQWNRAQSYISNKLKLPEETLPEELRRIVQYALSVDKDAAKDVAPELPGEPSTLGKRDRPDEEEAPPNSRERETT